MCEFCSRDGKECSVCGGTPSNRPNVWFWIVMGVGVVVAAVLLMVAMTPKQ